MLELIKNPILYDLFVSDRCEALHTKHTESPKIPTRAKMVFLVLDCLDEDDCKLCATVFHCPDIGLQDPVGGGGEAERLAQTDVAHLTDC